MVGFVIVAVCADVVTTWIFGFACGAGENSDDANGFCESNLYAIPLLGVITAVGGGVAARAVGRDWPWIIGTTVAVLLAASLWVLRGDPGGNF